MKFCQWNANNSLEFLESYLITVTRPFFFNQYRKGWAFVSYLMYITLSLEQDVFHDPINKH